MRAIKAQYFLSYAVVGALMPLLAVFLTEVKGFTRDQVGYAMATASAAMIFSPALITLLADTRFDTRRILAASFLTSAAVLSIMYFSDEVWLTIVLFGFHGMAFVAMMPLQDGFYFSVARQHLELGEPSPPYPLVRVWGTLGFLVPSLILYFWIGRTGSPALILPCAVGFCIISLVHTFRLPQVRRLPSQLGVGPERLPTSEAIRMLFSPRARVLCLALFLAFMGSQAFYMFLPIYMREEIGIEAQYVGLVMGIGVFLEILYSLGMQRMRRIFRLKGLLVLGLSLMTIRLFLVASFPSLWTVLAIQLVHGLEVMALFMVPVMFLDRLAGDRFRNSIQGVYTMTVGGFSRVLGAIIAGFVADAGLIPLFYYASGLALVATLVIAFLFKTIPADESETEIAVA